MPEAKRPSSDTFGPNAWLVDEMFEQFREDPLSVSESWREFFEGYKPAGANLTRRPVLVPSREPAGTGDGEVASRTSHEALGGNGAKAGPAALLSAGPESGPGVTALSSENPAQIVAREPAEAKRDGDRQPGAVRPRPPAEQPAAGPEGPPEGTGPDGTGPDGTGPDGAAVPLRGSAARVVSNMTSSLAVPTATSFRVVPGQAPRGQQVDPEQPAGPNRHGRQGQLHPSHRLGHRQAVKVVPAINSSFVSPAPLESGPGERSEPVVSTNGGPAVFRPAHVNLGIAVDLERSDGSRSLMVPVIKQADTLDFRHFWRTYEELVRKVRSGKVEVSDFAGPTITLTNPGTLGTVQSVPRLLAGTRRHRWRGDNRLPG